MRSLLLGGAALVVAAVITACSSGGGAIPPSDAGAGPDGGGDADAQAPYDGSARPPADSGIPPTTQPPPPAPVGARQIVTGDAFLVGVTSDGYAIYVASPYGDGALYAAPIGGGAPTLLHPFVNFADVIVEGRGVAYWTNVARNPSRGMLHLWSAASGSKKDLGTTVAGEAHFSPDGTRVAFLVNPMDLVVPPTVDVVVTSLAAPSITPVVVGANNTTDADLLPTCARQYTYVGATLYLSYCTAAVANRALVVAISPAGALTTVMDNTPAVAVQSSFALDANAQRGLFYGTNRELRVVTLAGGATTVIDTNVTAALLSGDGATTVYVKAVPPASPDDLPTFALRRSPTGAPAPVQLHDNVDGVRAANADLTGLLFGLGAPLADGRTDLQIVDGAPPSSAIADLPTAKAVGFSSTGAHALYLLDVGGASGTGRLVARTLGGGAPRLLSQGVLGARPLATGTKLAFCQNAKLAAVVGDHTTCDVASADAAGAGAPTVLAEKADPHFELLGSDVVFALMWGPSRGLWVKPVP